MMMKEDTLWTDVGQRLSDLAQLLQSVPIDSPHALQAQNILRNVRASKEEWFGLGKLRTAGRPQSVFLRRGDEAVFCQQLKQLLTGHLRPDGKTIEVTDIGEIKCSEFFALLYDACVQAEMASGCDDLLAYFNLIQPQVQEVLGDVRFTMAYKTLAARVNKWSEWVKDRRERVLLHRITQRDVLNTAMCRYLCVEQSKQHAIKSMARSFGLIPQAMP